MADLFFPVKAPSAHEIRLIKLIRYIVDPPTGDYFVVHVYNTELKQIDDDEEVEIPSYYYEHVQRFLWRHQALMEVNARAADLQIPRGMLKVCRRYITYMDAIMEGLLMAAREQDMHNQMAHSLLFDLYLVTENLVGRQDYDVGDRWRLRNPEIILECVDVESLDWPKFYQECDVADPVLSGLNYDFNITNVPITDWQEVADAAASFLGFTNPEVNGEHANGAGISGQNTTSSGAAIPKEAVPTAPRTGLKDGTLAGLHDVLSEIQDQFGENETREDLNIDVNIEIRSSLLESSSAPSPTTAIMGTPICGLKIPHCDENKHKLHSWSGHIAGQSAKSTPSPMPFQQLTESNELILKYPPSSAVEIKRSDLQLLKPKRWLNDTLIEFGLKLWLNELQEKDPLLADLVHIFSSFFYTKLSSGNIAGGYESVRSWTSKVDLFSKKYVIVPINKRDHWFLAIIYQPGNILQPLPSESPSTTAQLKRTIKCSSNHPNVVNTLIAYLGREAKERKNFDKVRDATGKQIKVPLQPNSWDCGIYLLHLSKLVMSDPEKYCHIMTTEVNITSSEWQTLWDEQKVPQFRDYLVSRITRLSQVWKASMEVKDCPIQSTNESEDDIDIIEFHDNGMSKDSMATVEPPPTWHVKVTVGTEEEGKGKDKAEPLSPTRPARKRTMEQRSPEQQASSSKSQCHAPRPMVTVDGL